MVVDVGLGFWSWWVGLGMGLDGFELIQFKWGGGLLGDGDGNGYVYAFWVWNHDRWGFVFLDICYGINQCTRSLRGTSLPCHHPKV